MVRGRQTRLTDSHHGKAAVASRPAELRGLGSWCREQFAGNTDLGDAEFKPEEVGGGLPEPPSFD